MGFLFLVSKSADEVARERGGRRQGVGTDARAIHEKQHDDLEA